MKKQILALSILTALYGCDLDNLDDKKVPATFGNDYITEVREALAEGQTGLGAQISGIDFDIKLTTGHGYASGTIAVSDVNYGEAEANLELTPQGKYGTFTLEYFESGFYTWSYDLRAEATEGLDEAQLAAVQQVKDLIADPTLPALQEVLTITTLDGTKQDITFTIAGVNPEEQTRIDGAFVARPSLVETSAFGSTSVYDPHYGESKFIANATYDAEQRKIIPTTLDENGKPVGFPSTKGYGSLFITEEGMWEFVADKKNQELVSKLPNPDDIIDDTVTITTVDGTTRVIEAFISGKPLNWAAELVSSKTEDSSFDINMTALGNVGSRKKTVEGKVAFKLKISDDLSKTAVFSMACDWNFHKDEDRRVVTFYIKPDGQLEMWSAELKPGKLYSDRGAEGIFAEPVKKDYAVFDQALVPGEWSQFTLSWEGASLTQKPILHASLDGEPLTSPHRAIPTDPAEGFIGSTRGGKTVFSCVNQMRFDVKADDTNGGTGSLFVDDVQFYNDKDADPIFDADTKAVLNEKFATNKVGDLIKDITIANSQPYIGSTDNAKVARD